MDLIGIEPMTSSMPFKPQNIDGTVLMNRHNRQKRPNGRYVRAKCGQNLNQVAKGLIVWNQPELFLFEDYYVGPPAAGCRQHSVSISLLGRHWRAVASE